jgi:TP901 family phage tail tape measure protein
VADQLGNAVLTLTVDDSQFNAGLVRAQSAAQTAGASLRGAIGALGVTTSAAGIAAFIGKQITELDTASAAVKTLGVDSDELVTRLRALSAELSNNISTVELTRAAYDVASSGFASAGDATNILRAAALGAKGGFADVADVASAVTGVLNAYGKSSQEASVLVDKFVQTQADGVITVRQYAAEIGNISSIAAASGISIEELNAAIATATLRGVQVPQTFTGLRQAISSIIKPSEQAKELANSLGIQFDVNALKTKGFGGVLADVQQKTGGAADKIAILLGSVEAQAAVQPLLNDKLQKYNELLRKQADAAGAAASASGTNSNTISSGLKQIGNGFSNLATTLDTALTPLLGGFIKSLNDILNKLNQVSALAPEKVLKREKQATDIVASQLIPGQGSGFFGPVTVKYGGKTYKGSATVIREAIIQELLKKDLAAVNATSARAKASPANTGSDDAAKAKAEVERRAAELAAQQAELEKKAAELRQRWTDAIATANRQANNREQIKIEEARPQLGGTGIGALQAVAGLREAQRQEQLAQAAVRTEPGKTELLTAATEAADNVRLAAAKTKSDLLEAYKAAKEAVQQISRSIEDSVTALAEARGTGEGVNKYIGPNQRAQRQAEANQTLISQADLVARSLGVRPVFNGTLEERNRQIADFIRAGRGEARLTQDIAKQQEDLIKANNDLSTVTASLADINKAVADALSVNSTALADLAAKDWAVYVEVPGGSASGDIIGAVNGAY